MHIQSNVELWIWRIINKYISYSIWYDMINPTQVNISYLKLEFKFATPKVELWINPIESSSSPTILGSDWLQPWLLMCWYYKIYYAKSFKSIWLISFLTKWVSLFWGFRLCWRIWLRYLTISQRQLNVRFKLSHLTRISFMHSI